MDKAHELAAAILGMSDVRSDGLIEFRMLDDYAEAVGLATAETDELFERACDILIESGSVMVVGGECHETDSYLLWLGAREDYRQAMADERQAYWDSVWR